MRPRALPVAIVVGFLLPVAVVLAACGSGTRTDRPNVIVIVMDTTRGDRTSLDGHEARTTPFLETLGRESTVYTDAWSPTCWTGPAHASLFTGLRPEHHGLLAGVRLYLDESSETLAEVLFRAGYETACLTCNPAVAPAFGLVQGFRIYESYEEIPGSSTTPSRRASARALEVIRRCRSRSRPFFVFLNHWQPHLPYDPPAEIARRFLPADVSPEEVAWGRAFSPDRPAMFAQEHLSFTPRRWAILAGLYAAEIATLDEELERFVSALREEGGLDETILVITSDHGENLGDHGLTGHFMSLHQSVRRIPLLIRYPGARPRGERVTAVARLEDIYPTILALCGEPVPLDLDGLTLIDPERGRLSRANLGGMISGDIEREYPEFARSQRWRPMRAVYDGRYHLIQRQDGHEELYDLEEDPSEARDLAPLMADVLLRLRRHLPDAPWRFGGRPR